MGLNKNTAAPKFEAPDEVEGAEETTTKLTGAQRAAAAAAARAAEEAETATSTETAVTAAPARGVAVPMTKVNPFKELENVFPVKFNTLTQVMANQGNFLHKDTNKSLGDTITMELVSTQKHWVLSPGGDSTDEESLKFVKYSDDGIVSQDGLNMADQLKLTIAAGYEKAKISERRYLVGCLESTGKPSDLVGQMVQIDLAPSSVAHFDRHQLSTSFAISKGKATADGQTIVKMECTVKSQGKLQWTEVIFSKAA